MNNRSQKDFSSLSNTKENTNNQKHLGFDLNLVSKLAKGKVQYNTKIDDDIKHSQEVEVGVDVSQVISDTQRDTLNNRGDADYDRYSSVDSNRSGDNDGGVGDRDRYDDRDGDRDDDRDGDRDRDRDDDRDRDRDGDRDDDGDDDRDGDRDGDRDYDRHDGYQDIGINHDEKSTIRDGTSDEVTTQSNAFNMDEITGVKVTVVVDDDDDGSNGEISTVRSQLDDTIDVGKDGSSGRSGGVVGDDNDGVGGSGNSDGDRGGDIRRDGNGSSFMQRKGDRTRLSKNLQYRESNRNDHRGHHDASRKSLSPYKSHESSQSPISRPHSTMSIHNPHHSSISHRDSHSTEGIL